MERSSIVGDRSHLWWQYRLGLALRAALACIMVACATMYGPVSVRRLLTYPAFSYVVTILIAFDSEATVGEAVRGCWHVGYATAQVLVPATFSLYVIGPGRFTAELAAAAVAAGTLLAALPERSHLMTMRIAFGQLVIVYVGAVVQGEDAGVLMHPLEVAASTAVGAVASVLAMLIPFPRLAFWEVKKTCRVYAENASERLNLYVKAITAQDNSVALDFISQAKPLSETATKLIKTINDHKEGMLHERPSVRFWRPKSMEPGKNLQDMEAPIRGMEISLASCPSFPVSKVDGEIRDVIQSSKAQIGLKLEQAKCSAPYNATTAPENKGGFPDQSLKTLKNISTSYQDLPVQFFLFCMELLLRDNPRTHQNPVESKAEESRDSQNHSKTSFQRNLWSNVLTLRPNSQRLVFAVKCSISMGLAVLFGIIYNKQNGYWSGLTIAISFVTGRQPTFTVANARAQGTAMGSIYGIICCFVLHVYVELRIIPLIAWVILSSFLRYSRMYGPAGSISAVIGALLILGRKDYGSPTQFAIARITEASIGLVCLILVEILLQPTRAATLAKEELSQSLSALHECIKNFHLNGREKHMSTSELKEKQKKLKSHVTELEKFIIEAEQEPNFWFLPFHGSCYRMLLVSISSMTDLLFFSACTTEYLSQVSQRSGVAWREAEDNLCNDLKIFQEKVCSTLKCLEEVSTIKSLKVLEEKWQEKNKTLDVELGKTPNAYSPIEEEEVQKVVSCFLQHSEEIADTIEADEAGEALRSKIVLYLSGMGFCINKLMRETIEIEKEMKELVKWENPSTRINLQEISSKVKSLYT